jgi:hypothetical protein
MEACGQEGRGCSADQKKKKKKKSVVDVIRKTMKRSGYRNDGVMGCDAM